jgi:nucleoside-diphosphate-sugar epimerase
MIKCLVTGANGFVGSHLVRELLKQGYSINCLVRHTSDISSLKGLSVKIYIGDLREPESLLNPVTDVEYIFHLAAEVSEVSYQAFIDANSLGTKNLLDAASEKAKNSLKRFLFVSSQAAAGPCDGKNPLNETITPNPNTWYGKSKLRAEQILNSFSPRIPFTIVRPSIVYGEREEDLTKIFPIISSRIQPKIGILKKYFGMIYVKDLVEGIIEASKSETTLYETYFLTNPDVITAKGVVKTLAKAMEKSFGIMIPVPIFLMHVAGPVLEFIYHFSRRRPTLTRDKARLFSGRYWIATPEKAKKDFNWEAMHSLYEGAKKTVKYYIENEREYREMPLEKGILFGVKYISVAILLGLIIEVFNFIVQFYTPITWWLIILYSFGFFGIFLGCIALLLRKKSNFKQFIIGVFALGPVEILNSKFLHLWNFSPEWITTNVNIWIKSLIFGATGGVFLILLNSIMRSLYKRRIRLG